MKKLLALFLVIVMLTLTFVSCDININLNNENGEINLGNGNEVSIGTLTPSETEKPTESETGKTTESETHKQTEVVLRPSGTSWDELDFQGERLAVLVRNDYKVSREWEQEDVGDDELDMAIAARNEVVESNLNVDVEIVLCASEWHADWLSNFSVYISRDIDNKLHEFDIVANFGFSGMRVSMRDYYVNLLDEDTFPYFNFELPCWNQSIVDNGTVNGRLYACAGDMNLSMFDSSMIIWHNMDLYDQLKQPDDPEDMQDLVLNGDWTYAEMYRWASLFINSGDDSECADIYGTSIQGKTYPDQPGDAIPYAWDITFVQTNTDGTHSFNFVGNTKAEQALEDFRKLYGAGGNAWHVFSEQKTDTCTCGTGGHFVSGGILFKGDVLFWSKAGNNAIREMEDRYALLCWPKYEDSQPSYYTTSQDYFTTMSVLDHSESTVPTKGGAVSAYLQFANEYSYTHVRGYYFERIVKPKFFGTDDSDGHITKSVTIFVTIVDNLQYHFQTIYNHAMNSVISNVWTHTIHNEGTIQSKYEADKKTYDDALKELDIWFGLNT